MSGSVSRYQPRTAPTPLLALILGLPVVFALAGLGVWEFATSNRQAIETHLTEVAKSTALALDAKLIGFEAAGLALATKDELQSGDVGPGVLKEARRIADLLGVHIVVEEAAHPGVVLLNTLLPPGQATVPRALQPNRAPLQAAIEVVMRTSKPYVTDVFIGALTGHRNVAVVLPVVANGAVARVVILAFPADSLAAWLADQNGDSEGFAAIRDGQSRIVAVSRNNDAFAGHLVPEWSRTLPDDHGILEGLSLRGAHTLYAYQHLRLAPSFAIVVARPVNGAMSVIKGPAKWLMISALAMIVLGVLSLVTIWTRRNSGNAALQEVNRLLSGVPAILYVNRVYPDGRFRRRFLSLSAERVTGWPNKALERDGALAEKTDSAFIAGWKTFNRAALETGQSQFEYRMRFADGTFHWMRVVGVCLKKEPEGSGDVLGFITDITEERAMREELRRTEKFALLGEVAGRISHEMNQPMAAISMAAENGLLALERTPANLEVVRQKFLRIEQQVERVIAVIGHISAFGRKQLSADLTELDIDRVLHSALAVAEPKMAGAGVSVRLEIPDDLPAPRGVAVLLEQIVVNLIVNACDAYQDHPGPGDRLIVISALVADGSFVLRVADRAGGIPTDLLGGIFDPFVTSKPPGKGTGLGLSFCLASVGRLGGQMTVTNVDGGASFYVTLPIASRARQHADAG
jgi:signal transduction histidine kinase